MATINAAVNRSRYKSWEEACRAVEALAGHVPGLPPKPQLPDWPWCERGEAWVAACLDAAAPHADAPVVANATARGRAMLDEWGLLRPTVRPSKQIVLIAREIEKATGCWPEEGETMAAYVRRAVATGKATPALATAWRDRLGVAQE